MSYKAEVLKDEPLLYWRLGETEGTTAQDETANNRDGTYGAGVTLGESSLLLGDAANKAVKLSGTSTGRITSAYNPFASGSTRTYEGWARRTSNTAAVLMGGDSAAGANQPLLAVVTGAPAKVEWYARASGSPAEWANAWPGDNQDVHWVVVYNDATKKATLWINGESKGEKSAANPYNTEPGNFIAGAWANVFNNPWPGKMDEIAIYSGALSEARIKAHYEAGSTEPKPPVATTGEADEVDHNSATLNGTVDPEGSPTTYWFEYGTTKAYGTKIPAGEDGEAGEGTEAVAVDEAISGLEPETTYHFRLVATNAGGTDTGEDETFTTDETPVVPGRKRRKPPLELDLEVETPDGFFRFAADDPKARNRFTGFGFSTARGDGFTTAQAQLARPIFKDYPDVQLLSTTRAIGRGGDAAYEGRLHSNPRTNDPFQQIALQLVGWMTYLKGRKIAPLIIDRRLSGWQEASTQRESNLYPSGFRFARSMSTGLQDAGAKGPAVVLSFSRFDGTYTEIEEAWFYAGGEDIGALRFDFDQLTSAAADASFWFTNGALSSDDLETSADGGTDVNNVDKAGVEVEASTSGRKYARFQSQYTGSFTGDGNNVHAFVYPRVIGTHGLTARGESPEEGYYLSDIIEYLLTTYYPKIEWAGQSNTFPVQHATWHDNPQDGWSIMQELNNLALWETNVWEGPKLYFEPADLTVHNWQIRTDQPGVSVEFQGDSVENFANGVAVTYTDFSGVQRTLYPPDHEELRDDSESNPYNKQNEYGWIPDGVTVPFPCLEAEALQFGRAYLAEFNRPKRVGQYRVTGHIEDSAGNWHPVWKVRNSETILVLDHPSDEPRLIYATDYNHDSRTVTITVDAPSKLLDAVVARQERARTARNLA